MFVQTVLALKFIIKMFIFTATMGQRAVECFIIDILLFSDRVALKIRLDLNVDHMFERNYCHRLAWHNAN